MYYKDFYQGLDEKKIAKSIRDEGFKPVRFSNKSGEVYQRHQHPETKLLAFLKGGMCVTIDRKHYICGVGDKLIIPGNTPHSALVDEGGCEFFWSEKLI